MKKFNSLGIILILVFYIIMFFQYEHSHRVIVNNAQKLISISAKNLESNINNWLKRNLDSIHSAANYIALNNENIEAVKTWLEITCKDNPAFSNMYYLGNDGVPMGTNDWKPDDFDLLAYIKARQVSGPVYTDDKRLNASRDDSILSVAEIIYDFEGKEIGVVGGDISVETVEELLEDETFGNKGFLFLIHENGKILAHPGYSDSLQIDELSSNEDYSKLIAKILAEKRGFTPVKINGVNGMLTFLNLDKYSWYLASFIPENEIIQQNGQISFGFLLYTIASLLIFIFFITLLNKFVKKPILAMEKNINRINIENDSSYRLPELDRDVLISLTRTINGLLDKIESFIEKIKSNEIKVKELNISLQESEERWQLALQGNGDGVWDWNIQTGKVFYSDRWKEIFGFDRDEDISEYNVWEKTLHPDDMVRAFEECNKHFRNEIPVYTCEYRIICNDGTIKWILARGTVVSWSDDGRPLRMVGTHSDITARKHSENKIKYLSLYDNLTGLYNRTFFEEKLNSINIENALPVGIIMCDVNGLKIINDAYGHEAGDKLISLVADILRDVCRNEDIIARIGGDEFGIILPGVDENDIFKRVSAIIEKCNNSKFGNINPSIAIGAAVKFNKNQDIYTICRSAENRMYKNKIMESKSVRSSLINSLRTSLENRRYETKEHSLRLKKLSIKLGEKMGLHDSILNDLELLAMLHDIGKIAIPDYILDKPDSLNDEEWEIMKKHSEIGYRIAVSSSELSNIADAILSHHERWDGKGYGQGLSAEEIPLIARIIAVVDAYDAMTNDKPYRKAISKEAALLELRRCASFQFDPNIVESFISLLEDEAAAVKEY